jgi:RimJ/RimL family protein N-acetyltransferase
MVNYVLNLSKLKGWQALYLWVLKQNKRAIAVYEANGFILEGAGKIDDKLTGHKLHEIRYIHALSSGC